MESGVPARAMSANHATTLKPGITSATVGKSGKFGSRVVEVTASALIEPAWSALERADGPSMIIEILPPMTSLSPAAAPG